MRIYLDYSASTPVAPEVLDAMKPYFAEKFGNPSSLHSFGREAEIAIDESREVLSRFFGVDFAEVYFTSGATEANNWIIHSASRFTLQDSRYKPHIITSAFEHESILEPVTCLERRGLIEATYLKPSREGFINPADVEKALKENTALVSIIYVNNEIGTIQPIKEIGRIIKKHQKSSLPVFHTDAVQAVQCYESRLDYLKVDAMTVSAHKIYGPKGVGALIARDCAPLDALIRGGGQEFGKRSGTPNVPGIVGFGKAIESLGNETQKVQRAKGIKLLKMQMERGIINVMPDAKIVSSHEPCAAHISSIIFPGIESQVLLIALDQEGIAVSSGAACSVKAITPSHVIRALGYSEREALSTLRFSFGIHTTKKEIQQTVSVLKVMVKRLQRSNGYF